MGLQAKMVKKSDLTETSIKPPPKMEGVSFAIHQLFDSLSRESNV